MASVGLREYGRMRGISGEAVRKAILSGRLIKSISYDEKNRPRIDPSMADQEWAAYTNTKRGSHSHAEPAGHPAAERSKPAEITDDEPAPRGPGNAASTFAQSRAVKEAYLARLAKLEFEEKSGKLVEADQIKDEAFRLARTVRDGILNVPDRISAELAAETDAFKIHQRLSDELRKALEALAGNG